MQCFCHNTVITLKMLIWNYLVTLAFHSNIIMSDLKKCLTISVIFKNLRYNIFFLNKKIKKTTRTINYWVLNSMNKKTQVEAKISLIIEEWRDHRNYNQVDYNEQGNITRKMKTRASKKGIPLTPLYNPKFSPNFTNSNLHSR